MSKETDIEDDDADHKAIISTTNRKPIACIEIGFCLIVRIGSNQNKIGWFASILIDGIKFVRERVAV